MKITAAILLLGCLAVSAAGNGQAVSLHMENAPVKKVLKEIIRQARVTILYEEKDLKNTRPVTINAINISLEEALTQVLANQSLNFSINGKTIFIKSKPPAGLQSTDNSSSFNQTPIDITGRVTDPDGNPLAGATVKVKAGSKATTTNNDGVFVLKAVDENAILEITYVGFETYTVAVNNRSSIVASLKIKPESLNEVVINKGYYTEKQKYSVGNVTRITSNDLERQPVNNPLLALKGMVPGLLITQANGIPGSGVTARIQGINSIAGGNDPLYVVDGVPYPSQTLPTTSVGSILGASGSSIFSPGGNGNPLTYINVNDIESIEVLKDADATSIYGSRAANGAILITTKAGKVGPTKVDVNFQQGWGQVSRSMDVLNTQQYIQMRKEAFANDNVTIEPTDANYDINGLWDQNRYTDWVKALIGGKARYTDINSTVSSGNSSTQYLVGATYHKETTVFPGNFNDQKGNVHFAINSTSTNKKFRLNLTGSYMIDKNQLPELDFTTLAYTLPPNAPALYNDDGSLNWAPNLNGNSSWDNPLAGKNKVYRNTTDNLISSALLGYNVLRGLDLSCRIGYTKLTTDEFSTEFTTSQRPELRNSYSRDAFYSSGVIKIFNLEPQLTYKKTVGKGVLDCLIGSTIQQHNSEGTNLGGGGFLTDAVQDLRSATAVVVLSTVDATYKYNAAFGRLNYNWRDKYVMNITARRDGSSRFGEENRFHNFGSAGGAWIFSEEGFIQNKIKFLSLGKLKVSYGTSGNDQVGDYSFLEKYISNNPAVPYQGAGSIRPNRITNPYLQWEETRKLSAGLDLGFLNDRIVLGAVYSRNRSSNQLLSYTLPIISGFSSIDRNFPAEVENLTWEFSLKTTNKKGKIFDWTSNINLTIPRNKLIAFPNLQNSSYSKSLVVGQPISINKVFKFAGVDPVTGVYGFITSTGSLTDNPSLLNDLTTLVNVDPKFYGGFQNSIRYRQFRIEILFQFIKQMKKDAYSFGMGSNPPGFDASNQPLSVLEHWQKVGDKMPVQLYSQDFTKAYYPYYNANLSDAAYVDASYVRLQNLSISYELNDKVLQKLHMKRCGIFLTGQNLFTISHFGGIDPENRSFVSLAPLKIYTAGLRFSL